ncbi:peptide-N-glycosidase F-related protein [Maribacter sp. 2304DJ31-5]|uniref:peptide-N-glycosidase F-related protein n=1 Tax=Maribacter sp. 2304DJ31-5 TaxID=3386273 RepID=UPI0039BC7DE1
MKYFVLFLITFSFSLDLIAQEKEHIISHKGETIVTDPSKGANSYKRWAVFPAKGKEVRQILLNLTFECPDGIRCADWDYVDHIKARPKNGTTIYEVARMLTPYGGRFQKDWKFQWQVDVTDFSTILRDSVEIDYIHTGYEDNKTRGWKVTADFEIMYGEPVAEILAIHKLYDGSYSYGNVDNPIENHLTPVSLISETGVSYTKIKIHQTGHGIDAKGCGEFCSKYRNILYNGKIIDTKDLWMECGDNPLYPQAGTWIFDRANWCPGYLLQPDEVLLKTAPDKKYTVDIDMEPFKIEKPSAVELLTAYAIEYGVPNNRNDVALLDIISPSTEDIHSRKNPNGGLPIIRIKNNGENTLKTLKVNYFLEGEKPATFTWSGNLPFGETALLTLPEEIYSDKASARFFVTLKRPNGKSDSFKADNTKSSVYRRPHILPQDIIVYFKTNAKPKQNSYRITDSYGKIIFLRDTINLEANKVYRDTLKLTEGNYSFSVDDTAGDGLEFWFKSRDGRGETRLLDTLGRALKHFESDFGSDILFNFKVASGATYRLDDKPSISVFPARTNGPITLDYFANTSNTVKVVFTEQEDESKIIEEHTYYNLKQGNLDFNLAYLQKMRCYVKVFVAGEEIFKNRIRLKE